MNVQQAREFNYSISAANENCVRALLDYSGGDPDTVHERDVRLDTEWAAKIKNVWTDPHHPMQRTLKRSNEFFISDSASYFLQPATIDVSFDLAAHSHSLQRMCADDYVPSEEDIIRARCPTTGQQEYNFKVENTFISMHDMGGQPIESSRLPTYLTTWLSKTQPNDINIILYVASMADYCRPSRFGGSTALTEQIAVFKVRAPSRSVHSLCAQVLCESPIIAGCGLMLFLNKKDVFERRILEHNDIERFYAAEYRAIINAVQGNRHHGR
jgi:hypothetical protein